MRKLFMNIEKAGRVSLKRTKKIPLKIDFQGGILLK